jgi:drug/metabolite transporter (DMT)-like permease
MLRGSVLAALAQVLVGSSVAVLGALREYPLYAGQGLRYGVSMLMLAMVLWAMPGRFEAPDGSRGGALQPSDYLRLLGMALTGMVGFNLFVVAAERRADPALVGVIVGGAPVVLALVTPLLARRMPSSRLVLAGLVVTSGVALAQGLGGGHVSGVLLAVGALLGEVSFALISIQLVRRIGAMRVSIYACGTAVLLCVLGTVLVEHPRLPTVPELAALAWMAVAATALAYLCWFGSLALLGAERFGLFTGLVPFSAVGVTYLIGTGSPTWGHLVGALLVGIGLLVGLTGPAVSEPTSPKDPRRRMPAAAIAHVIGRKA